MRNLIDLIENAQSKVEFKNTTRGSHSGQIDLTLWAIKDGQRIGRIDYSVYDGRPSIQMIEVNERRQGYGKMLLQALQSIFPSTEIDLGMLTDDGSALINSLDFEEIPNHDYIEDSERLGAVQQKLADYAKLSDEFHQSPSEESRKALLATVFDWNELHDEERELENRLRNMKPSTRLIK